MPSTQARDIAIRHIYFRFLFSLTATNLERKIWERCLGIFCLTLTTPSRQSRACLRHSRGYSVCALPRVAHFLPDIRCAPLGGLVNIVAVVFDHVTDILDQVQSINSIHHAHVERGADSALFLVPADQDVTVGSAIDVSRIKSTTLTNRTFNLGSFSRRMEIAASASSVGTSPAQTMIKSGSEPQVFDAHSQMPMPSVQ